MTTELQGVYMDTSVTPWAPFVNENIRAYSTRTGTFEGNANTDANGRFLLFALTDRTDWVPICTSRNSGLIIIDALAQEDLLRLLSDTALSVASLESSGFVSVDGEVLNYVDDYDAIVDREYLGSSPTVYPTIVAAKDEFPTSIWVRNPGDTVDIDFLSDDDTQRLAGKDADSVIIPVNLTLNRADFTVVEVGFDAKALTFSAARQQARDVLFTAAGYLQADSGASLCAAERCRFQSNTVIPVRIAGGVTSLLIDRPFFTSLTATVDHCIDIEGQVNRIVIKTGLFLTFCDVYHIGTTITGTGVTESKFLNCTFLVNGSCGGIDLYGSRNVINECDILAFAAMGANRGIRLNCPAGTNVDTEVSFVRFVASTSADVMFEFVGLDADGEGLVFEHCKAPNGGTFKGSQDMFWHGCDLRNCTVDLRSKTGQVIDGGDWTGVTLQNEPADLVVTPGTKGLSPRGNHALAGIEFFISGNGSVITTGLKGWVAAPFACTIKAVRLLADQSGAIKIDLWVDTYANYPPTVADTITASAVPEIAASGLKYEDTTLTGWTVALAKGDIIYYNVDSIATIEGCLCVLEVDKS